MLSESICRVNLMMCNDWVYRTKDKWQIYKGMDQLRGEHMSTYVPQAGRIARRAGQRFGMATMVDRHGSMEDRPVSGQPEFHLKSCSIFSLALTRVMHNRQIKVGKVAVAGAMRGRVTAGCLFLIQDP